MSNPTIGFIGYGNMAQAIAEGLVAAGAVDGADIVACAAHYDKLEKTMKVGAKPLHNAAEVVAASDMVVIAIKPYQIESASSQSMARLPTKTNSSYPSRRAGILTNTETCSAPISTRRISNAPFRTRRWPSARGYSSPKPTTR